MRLRQERNRPAACKPDRLRYVEGDDFHPVASVAKMTAGIPLDDGDGHEWLLLL
jgi:gluconokinase